MCDPGPDNKGYAVFHHDKEAEIILEKKLEACGSNVFKFRYTTPLEKIHFVINNSHHCQQKTSATCRELWFMHNSCTWLLGRSNDKLKFWGGGPQNGTGCACGIKGTCSDRSRKCNCDKEDGEWHTDQGYVTLKSVLPLSGIAIGDLADVNEGIEFTIGPLRCII